MSEFKDKYFANLKEVALGMPVGPFRNGYVEDFMKAFVEAAHLFGLLVMWVICMVSYPISIFMIAGLATQIDRRRQRAFEKKRQDFLKRMGRK
ncbi:hypothetical protein J2801_003595 [Paraburkholderia phenoliruptrix]|uniref:hypothetical protein n=1 Tax=Paraburkholderia phenoliruptrix TaxID=252970 RepID=UPI0028622E37|nr:hypothetical protein [Paraburkholderia phenoliruptrix]MDR6421307.1 hypothetical protein [Paraburkholderia phenoliruptrix]